MSSPHVEGIQPRLVEFGSTVGEDEGGEGSSSPQQARTKMRIIGPAVSKRVSMPRGPKRATHRHGESIDLDNEGVDDYHDKPFDTAEDMTVQTAAHTKTAQPPTLETGDGEDDDDDDIDEFDSGTAFSSLHCETPIPPLPRARIPSRLGAVSAQPCEPTGEPLTSQGMMLIGKPANTAKHIRTGVSLDDRRRVEKGYLDTPPASFLIEGRKMSGRITSLEEDLKPLLLCQSMGLKIETKPADFVPGTTAQIVFHCPRCLKHWKLSGMPTAPSECKEPHQPTRGPKYTISLQSHRIMKELEKLPEYSRQQLIKVLSRTRLLGADEELLELVNSVSSGFLQEPSTSPHASRRSRSPEKRSAIRISKDRNSPSPVEKPYRTGGLPNKQQRTRSANRKSGSPKTRKGAKSAGVKSAVPDVHANSPHHQCKQDPTSNISPDDAKEHMTKEVKHREEEDFKLTVDPPISPPLLPQPPLPSDKEPTYRFTYSTLPSNLGSTSSPPPESTPVAQTFSSEQSKSPEPILFTKESNIVQVSTLPVSSDEVTIPASKVSSHVLMEGPVQPSHSIYRSGTSLANHSSSRMRGTTESMPDSVNKILQQHKRQVEFLRQNFHVRLTNAFSFSMFELPKQYKEHNSKMRQKAKQIRKMKKPTSLGQPPQIMLRPHPHLKKIPPPLQTIPYRIKAKMSKA